jgi:hypothetical protein
MLQVDSTTSVAEAARLMTEQGAAMLTLAGEAVGRCLTYEDVVRGLRDARRDPSISALMTDDCPDPAPGADSTAAAGSEALPVAVEFGITGVFEPDTLLASQYADRVRRRAEFDPERRLMVAVLELAVHDYTKFVAARDRRGQALFTEVEAWIESRDSDWPFAFASICDALDLDAEYVRRGLRAWKKRVTGPMPERAPEEVAAAGEEASPRRQAG